MKNNNTAILENSARRTLRFAVRSRWPYTSDSRMAVHMGISWAALTSFWLPLTLRYLKQRLSHKSFIWRQIMQFLCCQNFLGAHRNVIYSFACSNGNFFSVYFCVCIPKTTDFGCMSGHGKPPLCQRFLPFRKAFVWLYTAEMSLFELIWERKDIWFEQEL